MQTPFRRPFPPPAGRVALALGAGVVASAGLLAAPAMSSAAVSSGAVSSGAQAAAQQIRYVDVSVATVWTSPSSPRPVDHDALTNPVSIPGWLKAMTPDQKEGLTDHNITQTQALYGATVYVLKHRNHWSEVAVPGQPSPKNALGYPGWIPDNQLTANADYGRALAHRPFALTDTGTSTWLYDASQRTRKNLRLSVNTRLPVLARTPHGLLVDTPDHGAKWLPRAAAHTYRHESDIPTPTGRQLVRTARTFLHQPYLWAGRSGFGVDCSGFTSTVYQLHGITIPRDSGPQLTDSRAKPVAKSDLQAGDLIFYGTSSSSIHHVAMYVGGGKMIEAYDHTTPVRVTPVRFGGDYYGAARYLS